jgi:hypothetical protein
MHALMTNATKTLTIIFVSLLAITVLVKWWDDSTSSQAFRTRLVDVDTATVNKMVIESTTQHRRVTLSEDTAGWTVTDDATVERYPADANSVQRALQQLNELNIKSVATRNPEKYTRFKVDSTGTKVSLYNDDTLLSSIYVGAPQMVSRGQYNSYVRPAEAEAVYTVEGFLNSTFGRNVDEWRDKIVWDVERDKIYRIDFLFPADSSYSVQRAGENSWISEGDSLNVSAVNTITNRLGTLRVDSFIDSLSTEDFKNETFAVRLQLDNGTQKTLRLKLPADDGNSFQAVASDYPYVFSLNKSSFENAVLKSRKELLKE